jgi:general nucleoside transport system ATP-binding protein
VSYGGRPALSGVSIEFHPGEVHALLGENGAGKTTLANVLAGHLRPDEGRVEVPGPVGYVHQHFALPPGLSAAECLLAPESGFRWVSPRRRIARFHQIERASGLDLGDPDKEAAALPVGARQRLEFAREVSRAPALLLLDEPTAALAPIEIEAFGRAIAGIAATGTAVVFITHRLPEVFSFSQRISLLRHGELAFTSRTDETSPEALAAEFRGGELPQARSAPTAPGPTVLEIDRLVAAGPRGERAVDNLSLEVRSGQVVAVLGVDGNGQRELAERVAGLRGPDSGAVRLSGEDTAGRFRELGGAVVPADRQREGLILDFSVGDNLRLAEPIPARPPAAAARMLATLRDEARPDLAAPVRQLSGGNQQKVVLARELSREPRLLLAVQPSRGLDLAATRLTIERLREAARGGAAVLLVTADWDEALAAADLVFVIFRGRLSGPFPPRGAEEVLARRMAGVS